MKGRLLLLAALAAAVIGLVVVVGAGARSSHGASTTLALVERATADTVTDTGAKGDSVGDVLTFSNQVYKGATKVGSDNGFCLRTAVGKAWECILTTSLSTGQITVEGPFYDASDSDLAITGGTQDYAMVRGFMHLRALNKQGTKYSFLFHLS